MEFPEQDNQGARQVDEHGRSKYAIYLPALSSFYGAYIGKQQTNDPKYMVPASRIPSLMNNGVAGLNWLDENNAYFYYPYVLHSAGHANLDLTKDDPKEYMVKNRDKNKTFAVGDSGGFQIAKAKWPADWTNPNDKQANAYRKASLDWLCESFDYAMTLDIPTWIIQDPTAREATNIRSHRQAVDATHINNEYFIRNRHGNTKFLNVLQGQNHNDAEDWYQEMKKYCDPKIYPETHFNGWGMGGQNMCDSELILNRLIALRFDGFLEQGKYDWMHFLGTSKLEWAVLLTDIQTAIRKYHNPNFTISFDCASPFLATANGQIYYEIALNHKDKWSYRMKPSVDDKKYALDSRPMRDVFINDGHFTTFEDSPISARCEIKDICIYAPGDLNKIGKEGRTSWDSFSYTLQMGHNVWTHIEAVQRANEMYAHNDYPGMLAQETFDRTLFRDVVMEIFATDDREKALDIVKHHTKFWTSINGTRGFTGKRTINATTQFGKLFSTNEPDSEPVIEPELIESKLDDLEGE